MRHSGGKQQLPFKPSSFESIFDNIFSVVIHIPTHSFLQVSFNVSLALSKMTHKSSVPITTLAIRQRVRKANSWHLCWHSTLWHCTLSCYSWIWPQNPSQHNPLYIHYNLSGFRMPEETCVFIPGIIFCNVSFSSLNSYKFTKHLRIYGIYKFLSF
jgi:hypothetical protein